MNEWRYRVTGKVQGVFFRANTHMFAKRHKLAGYVQNEPDGSVLVVAQGEPKDLQSLLEFLEAGPELASVENVTVEKNTNPKESFDDFEVTGPEF